MPETDRHATADTGSAPGSAAGSAPGSGDRRDRLRVAVIRGDGIGPDVTDAAIAIIDRVLAAVGACLGWPVGRLKAVNECAIVLYVWRGTSMRCVARNRRCRAR